MCVCCRGGGGEKVSVAGAEEMRACGMRGGRLRIYLHMPLAAWRLASSLLPGILPSAPGTC